MLTKAPELNRYSEERFSVTDSATADIWHVLIILIVIV